MRLTPSSLLIAVTFATSNSAAAQTTILVDPDQHRLQEHKLRHGDRYLKLQKDPRFEEVDKNYKSTMETIPNRNGPTDPWEGIRGQ